MKIITRKEALALGLSHYFTGKPCKYGHIAKRNKYAQCMECNRLKINTGQYKGGRKAYRKRHREQHRDAVLISERAYREANPDRVKKWRENRDPEKVAEWGRRSHQNVMADPKRRAAHRERARQWRLDNPERKKENDRNWRLNNLDHKNHTNRLREIGKSNRTPSYADLDAIKFFYECRPMGCHVDHIIPLHGKNISGLHVETNLQWLTAEENMRKNNSWT